MLSAESAAGAGYRVLFRLALLSLPMALDQTWTFSHKIHPWQLFASLCSAEIPSWVASSSHIILMAVVCKPLQTPFTKSKLRFKVFNSPRMEIYALM